LVVEVIWAKYMGPAYRAKWPPYFEYKSSVDDESKTKTAVLILQSPRQFRARAVKRLERMLQHLRACQV
jgi:hypothetical protein